MQFNEHPIQKKDTVYGNETLEQQSWVSNRVAPLGFQPGIPFCILQVGVNFTIQWSEEDVSRCYEPIRV